LSAAFARLTARIVLQVRQKDKLFIYNPLAEPRVELDQVILEAVFEGSDVDIGGKLRQGTLHG
jgi:hypothetical protein